MAKVACALSMFLGAAVPFAHAAHPTARAPTPCPAARTLLQRNIRKARRERRLGAVMHVGPSPCAVTTNRPKRT